MYFLLLLSLCAKSILLPIKWSRRGKRKRAGRSSPACPVLVGNELQIAPPKTATSPTESTFVFFFSCFPISSVFSEKHFLKTDTFPMAQVSCRRQTGQLFVSLILSVRIAEFVVCENQITDCSSLMQILPLSASFPSVTPFLKCSLLKTLQIESYWLLLRISCCSKRATTKKTNRIACKTLFCLLTHTLPDVFDFWLRSFSFELNMCLEKCSNLFFAFIRVRKRLYYDDNDDCTEKREAQETAQDCLVGGGR